MICQRRTEGSTFLSQGVRLSAFLGFGIQPKGLRLAMQPLSQSTHDTECT